MSQIFTRTCDISFYRYRPKATKLSKNPFPPSNLAISQSHKQSQKWKASFEHFVSLLKFFHFCSGWIVTSDSTIFFALSLHGSERDDLDIFHGCRLQRSSMRVSTQLVRRWNATLMARPERHQLEGIWVVVWNILYFHPYLNWGNDPIWRSYFSVVAAQFVLFMYEV